MLIDSDWSDFELWQFQFPLFVGCWRIPLWQTHLWSISSHKGGLSYFMDKTSTVKLSWKQKQTEIYLNTWEGNEQGVQRFLVKKLFYIYDFQPPTQSFDEKCHQWEIIMSKSKGCLNCQKGGRKIMYFICDRSCLGRAYGKKNYSRHCICYEPSAWCILYQSSILPKECLHSSSCTMRTSKEQTFKCLLDLRDVAA